MSAHNIWNDTALRCWIKGFADGNGRTAELLCLALEKPLRAHTSTLKQLKTLPPDAPGWLKEKFRAAAFHEFDPSLDPGLDEKIRHIHDWIAGAVVSEEAWTKEKKPKRLLHFKTVDDAMEAADKAMKEEALRLRKIFKNNPAAFDNENAKTVMTLEDGFRIVRLLTPEALDRESASMNHCIGNGGYDEKLRSEVYAYYSLRDHMNNPHATLEVIKDGALLQCKGKQNMPPEERYLSALRVFIEREKFRLAECHTHTGLWQAPDGVYHSIRRLPKGTKIKGDLDLSSLHDIVLPEGLFVGGDLKLNGTCPPDLPEGLKTMTIVYLLKKNRLHREGGPAEIWYDPETGVVTRELWWQNNLLHREGGPAEIRCDPKTGVVTHESWWKNDQRHREDGPAKIMYDLNTGVVVEEEWYKDNQRHREDGPAWILRDPETGKIIEEVWRLKNCIHREDGPAWINYDPGTGVITHELWYRDDRLHRENGPAMTVRDPETGAITSEQWWKSGRQIASPVPGPAKGVSCNARP